MFPRRGLIYSVVGDKYGVAFDDLNWRPFSTKTFSDDFTLIAADDEMDMRSPAAVRSVLIGRKGSLNLPCGFLHSKSPAACKETALGWEIFEQYSPAPTERCPARYARPPLDFALDYGDP
eukprot:1951884-Pleurochrysis_carterae.AAC.1